MYLTPADNYARLACVVKVTLGQRDRTMSGLVTTVRFTYNGKVREGKVEKRAMGANGEYITLKLENDEGQTVYRSFNMTKVSGFAEVAHTLG